MSDEMLNLINQARSQARSEGLKNFFGKNAKALVRVAVAILVVIILLVGFSSFQKSREAKFSEILHKSLINQQIGEPEKAKENLKEIYDTKSAPSGVRALASLRYAAFLLEEGKKDEAAKIYLEVNDCGSCDDYLQELAGLLAVKTWMSDEDELQKEDLAARIEKIENDSKTLRYQISEQRAFLEMQRNNLEKSYQIFEAIVKSPESGEALKSRASDGMKMVMAKGYEPKVAVKKEEKSEEKSEEKPAEKTSN